MSGGSEDGFAERPFRNRILTDENDVFQHNAWDNMEWDETQEQIAREKIAENSSIKLDQQERNKLEDEAALLWNKFYEKHQNKFFKDRHWLFIELPEIKESVAKSNEEHCTRVLEVGCGVGNLVFPILENFEKNCFMYCCDFSSTAIDLVKSHDQFDSKRCKAFVWDITKDISDSDIEVNSLDYILLVFVLSAVDPNRFSSALHNLYKYLKPGGTLFFRDYGLYDMVQLRFKPGKCIEDNFYMRGDGTRVYFFTEEEVERLFCDAGFTKKSCFTDRRLQVNRGKQLKMYRVWVQGKYIKPMT